jgi:hypothetical protein
MNILYFQTAEPTFFDAESARPMRLMNIITSFSGDSAKFMVLTTDFYHQTKRHRNLSGKSLVYNDNCVFVFLHSPGYEKHIGLRRIFDHICLGFSLLFELFRLKVKPDLVLIGYPPIFSVYILSIYARYHKIPYILDIKDQWPDIFSRGGYSSILVSPYVSLLKFIFKSTIVNSTKIVTISNGFKLWLSDAYSVRPEKIDVVFLSRPSIRKELTINNRSPYILTLIFAGSLTSVFDFDFLLKIKNMENVKVEIYGHGPEFFNLLSKFSDYSNVLFGGYVSSEFLSERYTHAHAILAPYRDLSDFNASIPNKILDAIDMDLPILTSLNGEVRELINKFEIGEIFSLMDSNFRDVIDSFILNLKNGKYLNGYRNMNEKNIFNHEKNYSTFKNLIQEFDNGK